ncbi:MAG: hypothetical protein JWL86_5649 [Rhizobium sp.]|nr:hypothetical protein [Rhizobium sp.]
MPEDATMARLEDQLDWYNRRSGSCQTNYKALKLTVIIAAAMIPLLSGAQLPFAPATGVPNWVLGGLGALIAIVEALQQLNQYHANWISYRSTSEALKHEKFLYLA